MTLPLLALRFHIPKLTRRRPRRPLRRHHLVSARAILALPQHPDQHRPERPILPAVDQEFAKGPSIVRDIYFAALVPAFESTPALSSKTVGTVDILATSPYRICRGCHKAARRKRARMGEAPRLPNGHVL